MIRFRYRKRVIQHWGLVSTIDWSWGSPYLEGSFELDFSPFNEIIVENPARIWIWAEPCIRVASSDSQLQSLVPELLTHTSDVTNSPTTSSKKWCVGWWVNDIFIDLSNEILSYRRSCWCVHVPSRCCSRRHLVQHCFSHLRKIWHRCWPNRYLSGRFVKFRS